MFGTWTVAPHLPGFAVIGGLIGVALTIGAATNGVDPSTVAT